MSYITSTGRSHHRTVVLIADEPTANIHYALLSGHRCELTQRQVPFEACLPQRGSACESPRAEFFQPLQVGCAHAACGRRNWGLHFDGGGRVTLYGAVFAG